MATETDARGNVKTHSYEHARGLLLGTSYSVADGTAATSARLFSYNHLGQLIQVVDAAGTRAIGYNAYGEQETDSLSIDGATHLVTEKRDSFGRAAGYAYAKDGVVQQTVSTGYGADGRIKNAGFEHDGEEKTFSYGYLSGSNLFQPAVRCGRQPDAHQDRNRRMVSRLQCGKPPHDVHEQRRKHNSGVCL